jgi:hypothetical protein
VFIFVAIYLYFDFFPIPALFLTVFPISPVTLLTTMCRYAKVMMVVVEPLPEIVSLAFPIITYISPPNHPIREGCL